MTYRNKLTPLQPAIPVPNLQAEANQMAKDVLNNANGTLTPPLNSSISRSFSSRKPRPTLPVRTSSKTQITDSRSATDKISHPIRTSGHDASDFGRLIDETNSRRGSSHDLQNPVTANPSVSSTRADSASAMTTE